MRKLVSKISFVQCRENSMTKCFDLFVAGPRVYHEGDVLVRVCPVV